MSINMFRGFGSIRRAVRAALGLAPVVAMAVSTQPVYAAPPANNIVSACSGVSLPRSVVTDIMSPVITGVATPTEASVNSLLGVVDGLILGPLLGVPTLNINATGLLNNAAAGQPITLQAISNSGTVIGPSDPCYSQATGFTLATPAGIAVGGNQITGLGSGTAATSGELNSIAFGNGAITNASALGSIAFGTNAQVGANAVGGLALGRNTQVTAAGSVALGDGSIASRGALTNYSATGLSALQSSAGEVSVGVAGSARQITNVAAGSSATDAVNVAQLQGVAGSVTALDTVAIKYNDGTRATATLGGAGGTTIANLRAGAVSASSTEAVNGSQLFATNSNVTANGTAINTLRNDVSNAAIGALRYANAGTPTTPNGGTPSQDVTLVGGAAGAVKLHNVADGAIAAGSTDAVNGGQIFNLSGQINLLADLGVQYDDSSKAQVTLGGAGVGAPAVTIANVKAGALGSASTEAVNGSQLFATNSNVTTNANAITNLRNQTLNGAIGTVQFSSSALPTIPNGGVPSQDMTLVGGAASAVKLHNVANGAVSAGSTDAVNGGQLFAVAGQVDLLSGLAVQYDDGTQTQVTLGSAGTLVRISNVANGALNAGSTEAVNGAQLFATNQAMSNLSVGINNGSVGPVRYSNNGTPTTPNGGTITNDVTMVGGAPGAVRIHNVADGSVAAGSTDGVNGGQLYTLQTSVTALGGLSVQYVDGSKTSIALGNAGTPVSITNVANGTVGAGSTDAVNGGQLFTTNQNVTNNSTQITNLANNVSNGAVGLLRYSNTGTPTTPNGGTATNDVTIVGGAPGAVRLHNVASGNVAAGSTDAVNGGQLFALQGNINALDGLAVQYDDSSQTQVTLGSAGTPVVVSNVANGAVNASSTDAVNGAQLFATNQNVTTNATAISNLSTSVNNGSVGLLRYSNTGTPTVPNGGIATNDVTIVGGAPGAVRLHNVADGSVAAGSTDGVNGGQLFMLQNSIASIGGLSVQYDDGTKSRVTLGGVGAPAVTIANVGNGAVNAASSEAINGSQLFATSQTLNTAINAGNAFSLALSNSVSNGGIGPVQYSSALTPAVPNGGIRSQNLTLVGSAAGPVGLHNVANGLICNCSTDAVNGGQLFGVANSVASILGYTYNPVTNSFSGNFTFGSDQYADVQNVFTAIYDQMTAGGSTSNTASKYFHTTSLLADSTASGADSTAIGPNAMASGEAAIATGRDAVAAGDGSVAIGNGATAQNGKAVSIGFANVASGDGAVAIGDPNMATGEGAIAMGKDNIANGDGTIALGNTNSATGLGSAAIGYFNTTNGLASVAIGNENIATGDTAFAVGHRNQAIGDGALAIGNENMALGDGSLAIGRSVWNSAADTIAMGNDTQVTNIDSIALGNRSVVSGESATAVGNDTTAQGLSSSAFGDRATATGDYSTALGSSSIANARYALAVGQGAVATGSGSISMGNFSQALAYGGTALGTGATVIHEDSTALGNAATTTRGAVSNYSAFGLASAQNSLGELAIARNISYLDDRTGLMTTIGERQITGVAAGSMGTDAVNVSQLRGVSSNLGAAIASSIGGGMTYNTSTGQLTMPSFVLNGATYTNVGDALAAISSGSGGSGGSGGGNSPVYDNSAQTSITLNLGGTTIHNVAAGAVNSTSTDAVNGSQLASTNQDVTNLSNQVDNGSVGTVQYSSAAAPSTPNGGTKTNDVTLVGAQQAPVGLHNVAAGRVAAGSTDAVNGDQLAATNDAVSLAQAAASRAVQYDGNDQTSVTLGSGDTPVALHNIAPGVSATDAVNVAQLDAGMSGAISQANAYTDARIAALSFDLRKISRDANAGTAGALAVAGLPQTMETGRGMLAMAAGTFQGQHAMAIGFSKASDNGRTVVKAGATYNSRGQVGANVGSGWQL
ncbi:YadA-like family protein [Sphingobium phenoxybenzoativorans]|uniref:YadA-like family protein n=1 Tax=Sphingobium phenoxybenzoativorans TaxID=1592790 RepID=UPI000872E086|nr:YadA-like family protein [Sphingobium phenoxybenzoativorans]